jgi:hypothetical protein
MALGISRDTFHKWRQKHPELREAWDFGKTTCQCWWENLGKVGLLKMKPKDFNTPLYLAFMGRNFRDTWKPTAVAETVNNAVYIGTLNVDYLKNLTPQQLDEELQRRLLGYQKTVDKDQQV